MRLGAVMSAVALSAALVACSDDGTTTAGPSTTKPPPNSAAAVALQPHDFPKLRRCGYSGPIESYTQYVEQRNTGGPDSIVETWAKLEGAGATEADVTAYAANPIACQYRVTGGPAGPRRVVAAVATSFVVKFADPATAGAAYAADTFAQSELTGLEGTTTGAQTGLGPSSIVAGTESGGSPSSRAVWQKGSFVVYLKGEMVPRAALLAAAVAEDKRIPPS